MSDTKKLDRLLRELDKTTAEVLRQTFEDLTKENARLKERIDQLEKNVTAFAGQLESWGFDAAAKQIRSEIGVDVEAPNFYKLQAENARLKEENERLYLLYQEAVEIIESAMDERCSCCSDDSEVIDADSNG